MTLGTRLQSRGYPSPAATSASAFLPDLWRSLVGDRPDPGSSSAGKSNAGSPPDGVAPDGISTRHPPHHPQRPAASSGRPEGSGHHLSKQLPPWGRLGGNGVEPPSGTLPVLSDAQDRIDSLNADTPALFEIADNPNADGSEPWHELGWLGRAAVLQHDHIIAEEARRQFLDPDLLRAVIYLENARGASYGMPSDIAYEAMPDWVREDMLSHIGLDKPSILPMNIQPSTWGPLGLDSRSAFDPQTNIRAGATLLRRIVDRVPNPDPAKIGSIYNFTGRENVNDYGAALARVYRERPWEERPWEDRR